MRGSGGEGGQGDLTAPGGARTNGKAAVTSAETQGGADGEEEGARGDGREDEDGDVGGDRAARDWNDGADSRRDWAVDRIWSECDASMRDATSRSDARRAVFEGGAAPPATTPASALRLRWPR